MDTQYLSEEYMNLIKECVEKGKEEVVKLNDHAADATRYLVCGMWGLISMFLPFTERE